MATPIGYTLADILCADEGFALWRGWRDSDQAPVLLRIAADAEGVARLEREFALRAELDEAWALLPLALERGAGGAALVLADPGGAPLGAGTAPLALADFLRRGAAAALALCQLHRKGLVHRSLQPGHILYDSAGLQARIYAIGEGSASAPFMAPEQTGRIKRGPDARTDLYALGIILYQMLTGALPFSAADSAEWIHCHVARAPLAPQLRHPGADPTCASIVLKLLAKNAEQRYQSAAGLYADLQHCLAMLDAQGRVEPFIPGMHDGAPRLHELQGLVGRAAHQAVLEEAARRVRAGGAPELLLVSGQAGTGKSALIAVFEQAMAQEGAIVVAGKFDAQQRDMPYATLAQALQKLVRQMLGQSEAALAQRRAAMLAGLGGNARLLIDLIPELRFLIGNHPAPPHLPPLEAQARFENAFRQFLDALGSGGPMLLLSLDDLQWIDPASLKLLARLLGDASLRGVMVLAACRLNDVGPSHPLTLTREALRRQGVPVRDVQLAALDKLEAGELVAASLGCGTAEAAPLSALVYAKTAGNPFFTLQFLARLAESGLLRYEHAREAWEWDAGVIGAKAFSDNVVELMVARLQQLPCNTLELVKLLACLGPQAGLDTIAMVSGMSLLETDECLWPATRLGLVMREPGAYRFLHDRVQEGAYSLIEAPSLPERHLHIGRLLLENLDAQGLDMELFSVVKHLNLARALITTGEERRRLAGLNALAGTRARNAIAYDSARHHLAVAVELNGPQAWQKDPEAAFALHIALAECEYLCGHLERATELFALLTSHARGRVDLARVALLRVALYQVSGRFELGVDTALEALALFDVRFPHSEADIGAALESERAQVARNLAGRRVDALAHEPLSDDPDVAIVTELLSDMGASVFSARPLLYPLLAVKALNYTLRFGTSVTSCMIYSRYAILLVSLGAIAEANAFSELALAQCALVPSRRRGRLLFVHGAYIHSWQNSIAGSVGQLEQAFLTCQESGDLPHAGYAAHVATWHSVEAGAPLAEVQRMARSYQDFAHQQRNDALLALLRCYEQFTLCLQGATAAEGSFDDERFRAEDACALLREANFGAAVARYQLLRQIAAYTFGDYEGALAAALAAAEQSHFFLASLGEASHYFFHALTLAALYPAAPPARQRQYQLLMERQHARLRNWARHAPANFAHRELLLGAELARLRGAELEAMRGYDQAIAAALQGAFVHGEALACELAARFHRGRGAERIALAYARDAMRAWRKWGAHGKLLALQREWPGLRARPLAEDARARAVLAAARQAQALSALTGRAALVEQLLTGALEHAGATRALLLLGEAGGLACAGEAQADASGVRSLALDGPPGPAQLPLSLLQFVLRTREAVLLDDALANPQFCADPYVRAAHPRSVLCMALQEEGAVCGILYLENPLAPGLFTRSSLAALALLCGQAVLSLRTAATLEALQRDNAAQREQIAALRRDRAAIAAMGEALRLPLGEVAATVRTALAAGPEPGQAAALAVLAAAAQSLGRQADRIMALAGEGNVASPTVIPDMQ